MRLRMELILAAACFAAAMGGTAMAQLRAGVGIASITPLEAGLATQLGGYGERAGKPAEGIHDTILAKAVVFDFAGAKSAFVMLDVCHLPRCVVEESLAKADLPELTYANTLMSATHTHVGIEGMSLDRRNIVGNPHIGVFDEAVLGFVTDRVAQALKQAAANLQPVRAGAAVTAMPGFNRNRRHNNAPTDEDMTVLRLDTEDGKPFVVLVNYTAHPTISEPETMLISGEWPGVMQRTVEDLLGPGVTCVYTNGAEGDVAPAGHAGGSRWERIEGYGRRIGIAAAKLADGIQTVPVSVFSVAQHWVELPERVPAPDFAKIAGDEYKVDLENLGLMLNTMFPGEAALYLLRVNDFAMLTFPGEPITEIGLNVKKALREAGVRHPAIACLTNDLIGYILTPEEYRLSGYEVTASFYGDTLGTLMLRNAQALAAKAAQP